MAGPPESRSFFCLGAGSRYGGRQVSRMQPADLQEAVGGSPECGQRAFGKSQAGLSGCTRQPGGRERKPGPDGVWRAAVRPGRTCSAGRHMIPAGWVSHEHGLLPTEGAARVRGPPDPQGDLDHLLVVVSPGVQPRALHCCAWSAGFGHALAATDTKVRSAERFSAGTSPGYLRQSSMLAARNRSLTDSRQAAGARSPR